MDIAGKIAAIDALKQEIDTLGKLTDEVLKKINYKFRLDWNFYSNSMEGNTLTRSETRSIMIGNITINGKPIKDVLEVKGHDEVIQQILKIGKGGLNISEKRIKEIHRAIMHEEDPEKKVQVGEWKIEANEIINYTGEKFAFTPPADVKDEMHDLMNWLNAEADKIKAKKKDAIHPAILAFEFHIRYLTIHPFFDGNGRTARILMNLILISFGYPPVIINIADKTAYYKYLADVQAYDAPKDFYYDLMLGLLHRSVEIVHKAVKGERIEEPDDLDKEIAFLRSQIDKKNEVIIKDDKVVKELYEQSLKPLFYLVHQKLVKFDDLFDTTHHTFSINNGYSGSGNTINYFDQIFDRVFFSSGHISALSPKDVSEFTLFYQWRSYKKNGVNLNLLEVHLNVDLKYKSFCISGIPFKTIEKTYSDQLSKDEQEYIVTKLSYFVLEEIKRSIDNL